MTHFHLDLGLGIFVGSVRHEILNPLVNNISQSTKKSPAELLQCLAFLPHKGTGPSHSKAEQQIYQVDMWGLRIKLAVVIINLGVRRSLTFHSMCCIQDQSIFHKIPSTPVSKKDPAAKSQFWFYGKSTPTILSVAGDNVLTAGSQQPPSTAESMTNLHWVQSLHWVEDQQQHCSLESAQLGTTTPSAAVMSHNQLASYSPNLFRQGTC